MRGTRATMARLALGVLGAVLLASVVYGGPELVRAQENLRCVEFGPPAVPYPCWYLDLNKDGVLTNVGDVMRYSGRVGETCVPYPYDPPLCGGGGGVCQLTEAQGVDFVNAAHTLVVLMAIGVPCLVACVTALVFLFFRRG